MTVRSLHLAWAAVLVCVPLVLLPTGAARGAGQPGAGQPGAGLPDGMLIVGRDADTWHMYLGVEGGTLRIATAGEPRSPAIGPARDRVAYIAPDGSLHEVVLDGLADRALLSPSRSLSFTQPTYGAGDSLYVVVLRDGSSADTDIQRYDRGSGSLVDVLGQRSAQFEPHVAGGTDLYYGHVSCTAECGRVIQEIWTMNLASRRPDQITLLNAVSRQPFVHDGHVYFSSNRDGYFHIWRSPVERFEPERLTDGIVTDAQPVVAGSGLYFLRTGRDGTVLMHRPAGSVALHVVDPGVPVSTLKDLRYAP